MISNLNSEKLSEYKSYLYYFTTSQVLFKLWEKNCCVSIGFGPWNKAFDWLWMGHRCRLLAYQTAISFTCSVQHWSFSQTFSQSRWSGHTVHRGNSKHREIIMISEVKRTLIGATVQQSGSERFRKELQKLVFRADHPNDFCETEQS